MDHPLYDHELDAYPPFSGSRGRAGPVPPGTRRWRETCQPVWRRPRARGAGGASEVGTGSPPRTIATDAGADAGVPADRSPHRMRAGHPSPGAVCGTEASPGQIGRRPRCPCRRLRPRPAVPGAPTPPPREGFTPERLRPRDRLPRGACRAPADLPCVPIRGPRDCFFLCPGDSTGDASDCSGSACRFQRWSALGVRYFEEARLCCGVPGCGRRTGVRLH